MYSTKMTADSTNCNTVAGNYIVFGLSLTASQKETLAKVIWNVAEATLRLTADQLITAAQQQGEDKLALTSRQIAHIKKFKNGAWC